MGLQKIYFIVLSLLISLTAFAEPAKPIKIIEGTVTDTEGNPLPAATVYVEGTTIGTISTVDGHYKLKIHAFKESTITAQFLGYESKSIRVNPQQVARQLDFVLKESSNTLEEVEVFGVRDRQPDKLELITRMPLRPSEQIQSISVISNRMIEEQGSQSLTDAVQNVVGVNQFANYGGVQESLSARGYRGL
ncbi:MAG: carboxypeptidase-like regulatory domain-containing protein, partial [Bacteroides sp.]